MTLTTKKQSNKKMGFSKHTLEKTQACKKHQYKMKVSVKHNVCVNFKKKLQTYNEIFNVG